MRYFSEFYALGMLLTAVWWLWAPEPPEERYTLRTRITGILLGVLFWPSVVFLILRNAIQIARDEVRGRKR